ncbi:hypothetical protein ACFXKG_08175 [Streptomyces sp. NPDC059255]|uniref:hypothetical protein n=1 Tax=Streptomyces sp. NPDC059255 TaxID=3346793 RepID=UPI003699077F
MGDIADDYKKAWDDLLDRDDEDSTKSKKKKSEADTLAALSQIPALAALPLGAVQALASNGAGVNPMAGLSGLAAANPLALAGVNPAALLSGGSPLGALGTAGQVASPLAALAGTAQNAASLTADLAQLPQQLAQLTEGVGRLMDLLENLKLPAPASRKTA